jgi:hypothetical protein
MTSFDKLVVFSALLVNCIIFVNDLDVAVRSFSLPYVFCVNSKVAKYFCNFSANSKLKMVLVRL